MQSDGVTEPHLRGGVVRREQQAGLEERARGERRGLHA